MNKITQAFFAVAATVALVSCNDSSTAPKSSGRSSSVSVLSSSVAGSSSAAVSSSVTQVLSSSSTCTNTPGSSMLTDCRDGQTYKTVVIGTQTWMAQNLDYTPTSGNSWCFANNCTTYGRLYDYATALTVCPTGWHLPDTTEWDTLEATVGGETTAGTKLKAVSGWDNTYVTYIPGTDNFGFSALPGGCYVASTFVNVSDFGQWWTATANGSSAAWARFMVYRDASVIPSSNSQTYGFSVRCLKD